MNQANVDIDIAINFLEKIKTSELWYTKLVPIIPIIYIFYFIILGLYQSDYDHFRHTISELSQGKLGWIHPYVNVLLLLSIIWLSVNLWHRYKLSVKSNTFLLFNWLVGLCSLVSATFFSADKFESRSTFEFIRLTTEGKIHFVSILLLYVASLIIVLMLIKIMLHNETNNQMTTYTILVYIFNLVVGSFWFASNYLGLYDNWLGLIQKIIITNSLLWVSVIGRWIDPSTFKSQVPRQ